MTLIRPLPVWRSLLFVPVNVERFVAGAHTRGADAIILDLEDSILPQDKERARTLVPQAARRVSQGGADVVVRVNRPWRLCLRDLEAAVGPGVQGIFLPKTESAEHVRLVAEVLDDLEDAQGLPRGHTRIVAMIESADAFFRAREIADAHPRLAGLNLGAEDFALSVGMEPEAEGLFYPKQQIILAARAAGILPLGFIGTVADYKDLAAFRETVRRSRRLGFLGASVIHPAQVPILNEEFRPGADEVARARRIVAAYEEAQRAGRGAFEVDGKMVDIPIVERARATLQRHEAIEARAARRGAP